MRARVSIPERVIGSRFPPDSQVVVPTGVTVGGVFGVPIPDRAQLAYERELENQAKEEEEEDSKPRADPDTRCPITRLPITKRRITRFPSTRAFTTMTP